LKLLTKVLPDNHNLFFFGDKHDGSILSSDSGWNQLIEMMHSDYEGSRNNFGAEGGDDMESILVDDKRFSPDKLTQKQPLAQLDICVEKRQAIKDLLLYKLLGNHEYKLWKFGNLTETMCQRLGVEYATYSAKTTIMNTSGEIMYKVYDTHGSKSITSTADDPIRKQANMELILKRHLKNKAGDCAVMIKHHAHKLIVSKPQKTLYLTDDGHKIKQNYTGWGQAETYIHPDARWYGCAGSFLRLFGDGISGYAELAEYDPVELGFLILKVRDRKIVSLDPVYLKI
jgi:hypothetical protein